MKAYEFISEHEKVVAHFGQWPSFHDAEVQCLKLYRPPRTITGDSVPTLELHLRGWILDHVVSEPGFFKLNKDAVVHLRFEGISELRIQGFNNQNVLWSLDLEVVTDPNLAGNNALKVELRQCYEFEACFKALSARVISVTPHA